jgi:hypothetical protein
MDKLDKLKENWQSEKHELPKVSFDKIYKMLLKKSSSIVKWIFVISIIELFFWISLYFTVPEDNINMMKELGLESVMYYSEMFHFFYIWYFYHLFL